MIALLLLASAHSVPHNDLHPRDPATAVLYATRNASSPTARDRHTVTAVGTSRAYVFGGRALDYRTGEPIGLLNDLHFFDIDSLHWSGELARPYCCSDPVRGC